MHSTQVKLLQLSKNKNLAELSLREMARLIGMPGESPQKIKHHLSQLQFKGFLSINRHKGIMNLTPNTPAWTKGLLNKTSKLFSIPIVGTANCGPATIFAENNFQGFLRVSSKLINRSTPTGLFAIRTNGFSMNRAKIGGKTIGDGDFVIVDSKDMEARTGNIVVIIIDNKATIKYFVEDKKNQQIVLKANSSLDYDPIYLHPDDDFTINGKVIAVIKKPINHKI